MDLNNLKPKFGPIRSAIGSANNSAPITTPRNDDIDGVIDNIGHEFVRQLHGANRHKAWAYLADAAMTNLAALTRSGRTQPLRDIVSLVMDIDKTVLGGAAQGNRQEPLDAIAKRWTVDDDGGDSEASE